MSSDTWAYNYLFVGKVPCVTQMVVFRNLARVVGVARKAATTNMFLFGPPFVSNTWMIIPMFQATVARCTPSKRPMLALPVLPAWAGFGGASQNEPLCARCREAKRNARHFAFPYVEKHTFGASLLLAGFGIAAFNDTMPSGNGA